MPSEDYGGLGSGVPMAAAVAPDGADEKAAAAAARPRTRQQRRNLAAFWLLGLLNNYSYVFMNAAAQSISDGGVGLVYLANIAPTMLIKLTVPYWAHLISYRRRVWLCGAFGVSSFFVVGATDHLGVKLFGVVLASISSGWGEATLLALSSFYETGACITCWSSGTGFAGIAGYAMYYLLHTALGMPPRAALFLGGIWPLFYVAVFELLLERPPADAAPRGSGGGSGGGGGSMGRQGGGEDAGGSQRLIDGRGSSGYGDSDSDLAKIGGAGSAPPATAAVSSVGAATARMSARERRDRVLSLWPYMLPLFAVYFSEYALQSGAWAAIGFPVTSKSARESFYELANWSYQGGVFVSRSSGVWLPVRTLRTLWIMPVLQCANLVFFVLVAKYHFLYGNGLVAVAFYVGLLGGAVYVNAYTLISKRVEPAFVEFSLSAASVADTFGILLSVITGLYIQCAMYKSNGIEGAVVTC